MIPAYFVPLQALPLTSSGKVDRKALPPPDENSLASGATYEAPRNEIEQILADLWKNILRKTSISIHDNFLSFGRGFHQSYSGKGSTGRSSFESFDSGFI